MAIYHGHLKVLSRSDRSTVGALAYRSGTSLNDERTGEIFNYRNKAVEHVEFLTPENAPQWAKDLKLLIETDREKGVQKLSTIAEAEEKRVDSRVYKEFEFSLPAELTTEQNIALIREFIQDQFCQRGIAVLANFHDDCEPESGQKKPHCHAVLLTRELAEMGLSKDKNRDWDKKELLLEWREQLAAYTNFHLQLHGHQVRIDHRSYAERGIDIEPQPKLSRSVQEMEKRHEKSHRSVKTDKAQDYQHIKLKNLYRLMRRPELVFDILHKSQSTFMWGDIQRILARYIDDPEVFQVCQAYLKNSSELKLLRETEQGHVFTTQTMLKKELSLVHNAQELSQEKGFKVTKQSHQEFVAIYDKKYEKRGGLSSDQKQALAHILDDKKLVAMVGYAGTGKTSILQCAQDIWQANGYKVYGFAPTGKAAQNLQTDGIKSMTVHKFLRQYQQGRSQFNAKSVLILDEAGMIDVNRFEEVLSAVQKLGVKLVTVGDGRQLQPIEAGAAFRLVTQETGVATLKTVIRQEVVWMKEATRHFGQGNAAMALSQYVNQGCIKLVQDPLPDLSALVKQQNYAGLVDAFNLAVRSQKLAGWTLRSDIDLTEAERTTGKQKIDLWKTVEKQAAQSIAANLDACREHILAYQTDPSRLAENVVDPSNRHQRQLKAKEMARNWQFKLHDSRNYEFKCNPRHGAMTALIQDWHQGIQAEPDKSHIIMAYTLKETEMLNEQARKLRLQDGALGKESFSHRITRLDEDDFGDETRTVRQRAFARGDRLLFMKNDQGLEVRNGMLGTIEKINARTITVRLDGKEEKTVSFASKLYPYFDLGWAININKQQGATNHKSYILASNHFNSNLSYVALTRHTEEARVYASSQEFWTDSVLVKQMAKSQEKLSSLDYIDPEQALKLARQENSIITEALGRVSQQLKAIHYTAKRGLTRWLGKEPRFDQILEIAPTLSEAQRQPLLPKEKAVSSLEDPLLAKPSYEKRIEALYQAQADQHMRATTGRSLRDYETAMSQFMDSYKATPHLAKPSLDLSPPAHPQDQTYEQRMAQLLQKFEPNHHSIDSLSLEDKVAQFTQKYQDYQQAVQEGRLSSEDKEAFIKQTAEFAKDPSVMTSLTLSDPELKQDIDRLLDFKEQQQTPTIKRDYDLSR
ncbi:AAA family ATPase [Candidatus Odyssella thessalonicensis]|uniref:AAA family ATPase n=1 Tax=Candidatus Odyssella thessalonicensis TaxID=84647 RepID=UPI000225BB3F|nr:AAA family ATPase [Candidatus Odyssella thessalonicensis]